MDPEEVGSEGEEVEDGPPTLMGQLTITKSGEAGALSMDLEAGYEGFNIMNVALLDKSAIEVEGAEALYTRRKTYLGPGAFCSDVE